MTSSIFYYTSPIINSHPSPIINTTTNNTTRYTISTNNTTKQITWISSINTNVNQRSTKRTLASDPICIVSKTSFSTNHLSPAIIIRHTTYYSINCRTSSIANQSTNTHWSSDSKTTKTFIIWSVSCNLSYSHIWCRHCDLIKHERILIYNTTITITNKFSNTILHTTQLIALVLLSSSGYLIHALSVYLLIAVFLSAIAFYCHIFLLLCGYK